MGRVVHVLGTLTPYTLADKQNAPAVRWETATGTWGSFLPSEAIQHVQLPKTW